MKHILFTLLLSSLSFFIYSQEFQTGTAISTQFQRVLTDIAYGKEGRIVEIDGNKYFYKKSQDAVISLFDGYQPIRIKANYNIIKETIEIESEEKILNLKPNKVRSVSFRDANFIAYQGNFYKQITQNNNFSLIRSIILKAIEPEYKVGIVDKPNLRYKRADETFIEMNGKKRMIRINKKAIIELFNNSKASEIKKFIKSNKISIRDDAELKILFDTFQDDLKKIR
jgi:hypothetical protein